MEQAPILKRLSRWVPKRWDAIHEQIVAQSLRGMSNKAIADSIGYTEQQISRILNSPQAEELRAQYKAQVRKNLLASADSKLDVLQAQAMENIERTLTDKELQTTAPFQMLKASMEFMKGVGKMVGNPSSVTIDQSTNVNQNVVNLPAETLGKLISGVERANRILEIHSGIKPPIEISGEVEEKIA